MLLCLMRFFTLALAVTLFAAPAQAGPISDAIFGRPFAEGAVTSGAFGFSGSDYYGNESAKGPRRFARPQRHAAVAVRRKHMPKAHPSAYLPPVAAHPYRP
ncbi:hypothetical protein MGN01_35920 [Methylobacterium gnaphalii]|uniref:Uncharacterized protein n=1 Tax=Methylobacterium gnaphalii TaxID=1010610 RepID=A0A512JP66_9HYPH|nr:hypothetical protein MGN01_35920 [Methylobacterium gnaphalii]GLS50244.1 hypothetical protein GCM10007885_30960 [Methylobacterium gnaphalii]